MKIADGLQNALDPILGGLWSNSSLWFYIRKCNIFLEKIGQVYNLLPGDLERWTAEVKAMKAHYYFEFVRRYGPIVLVPKNIDVFAPMDEQRQDRQPLDTCFKVIVGLLDEAIPALELMKDKNTSEQSYFSKEAAMGLKAQVLLYAASPLYNAGIPQYRGVKNRSGQDLFPVTPDPERWRIAAEYTEEVIDFLENSGYALIQGTTTEASALLNTMRDLELSLWAPSYNSTEAVIIASGINMNYVYTLPLWSDGSAWKEHYDPTVVGGLGTNIRMVNKFYTKNGLPMAEDKTWPKGEEYKITKQHDSRYTGVIPMDAEVLQLHLGREPRFYASIAAPGLYWRRGKQTDNGVNYNLLVDARKGKMFGMQDDRILSTKAVNITGYYVKKNTRSEVWTKDYYNNISSIAQGTSVYMRLAELYLNVAEAWNEYEGPNGAHRAKIFDRLNLVRKRAGIPTVEESYTQYAINPNKFNTQSGLREIIHNERTNELMFEGHRFWDVRRWGIAIAEGWNDKPQGWNVMGETWNEFYNYGNGPIEVWGKAGFSPARDYFFPIKSETTMISGIAQNPGW